MYSKCMVSPLMSTPTAMMASKAPEEEEEERVEDRSGVDEARRSVAEGPPVVDVLWIWEAEKRLHWGRGRD